MQFRESNLETIQLVNGPTDFDGALTDDDGAVIGLWLSGQPLSENLGAVVGGMISLTFGVLFSLWVTRIIEQSYAAMAAEVAGVVA